MSFAHFLLQLLPFSYQFTALLYTLRILILAGPRRLQVIFPHCASTFGFIYSVFGVRLFNL